MNNLLDISKVGIKLFDKISIKLIYFQNHGFEKKRHFTVINGFKEYDVENKSEIESDSNEEIQYIGDYLYLDGEEVDNSISTDLNVDYLQKFLQREMEFYSAAFPHDTLSQSFLRQSII